MSKPFSVILLPTLECNVACDYCFEEKSKIKLSAENLPVLTDALLEHMERRGSVEAQVYWQGGEVMMLGPAWFENAHEVMGARAAARGLRFKHYLQTNLIGWSGRWYPVVRGMFENSLGTSMDYPNVHRRLKNGSTEQYTALWLRAVRDAQAAGIDVGSIAVLNRESVNAGASPFYSFFVDEARLTNFQVNMPFPGGPNEGNGTLECESLGRFLVDLMDVWMERGYDRGINLGPFDELLKAFAGRPSQLPCIWQQNCANEFVSIDARGQAALCDCWVTSYPEHSFGNVFRASSLSEMLGSSEARARFLDRPGKLMETEECGTCPWLSMCHGGCPVRTFTATGTVFAKDPYCEVYKVIFAHARTLTAESVRKRLRPRVAAASL
jgi:radical SAM protein with 4Fe4S-binding SPASM domain